jgi:hypothetical protein
MNTRKLESFASAARTLLIAQVGARMTAVLSPTSAARVEAPTAVRALEARIRERGGGEEGRRHVAEEQAYVWFNRIIALRFMDANGYTSPALVSPDAGRTVGQPAVLAAAKRGELDPEAFRNPASVERIIGLLDGTVSSPDAQGEAYGLILAAYCAHWNTGMPFMFAREGDYTGLLMPTDMLSQDSVRARAVEVLSAEDCRDVEVIGWLYQFYISERKNEVFAAFSKGRKAGADEIPAATQLFTPDWIVRYLVQNSVGRLWMLNHPESRLVEQMEYYVEPEDRGDDVLRISKPEELTVMDPCCGSGHMLTYAFDLLYAIYEEEGYAPSEIPGLILTHNLYGTEIDPRAAALASFALMMKARSRQRGFLRAPVQPRICVVKPVEFTATELDQLAGVGCGVQESRDFWQSFMHADVLGSLILPDGEVLAEARKRLVALEADTLDAADTLERAQRGGTQSEYLARTYTVVVTNPPYMGSGKMGDALSRWLKKHHPEAKSDLMTAFMERAYVLCESGGLWGMINLPAWMALSSFARFRKALLRRVSIDSLLHLGRGVFGSDFGSVAFVVVNGCPAESRRGVYRRLFDRHVEVRSPESIRQLFLDSQHGRYVALQTVLRGLPGARLAYWLSPAMTRAFTEGRPLGEVAAPKQGLATADNARFLRLWFEVSRSRTCFDADSREAAKVSGATWFPHLKGGEFRKWWGNQDYVVNWANDGAEIQTYRDAHGKQKSRPQNIDSYFKPAISWSLLSSGAPSFRYSPAGSISGHKGPVILSDRASANCGLLNSSVVESLLQATSPGVGFEIGHLSELPMVDDPDVRTTSSVVDALVAAFRSDWNAYETSWGFAGSPLVQRARPGKTLSNALECWWQDSVHVAHAAQGLEMENNRYWARVYDLEDEVPVDVPLSRVSLTSNPWFRYAKTSASTEEDYHRLFAADAIRDLISYGVGCILGRYSLDVPGVVLADEGSTLDDYLRSVPDPSFRPDSDGIIPVTDVEWFEDDIVTRFRAFLAAAFGRERLEANVRYIEDVLGKSLRQYFVKDFYRDHCKRYSYRPIYWMFSSRPDSRASFRALIYLHRYTPSTPSTVLGEYLRAFQAKLRAAITRLEDTGTAADLKRADAHRRALAECEDYEREVLFPLASRGLTIDLDDGVLVNYLRMGRALQKVESIEKKRTDAATWTWPNHPVTPEGL